MTPEQEAHLQHIKDEFCRAVDAKYRNGQREHGGNMWRMPVLSLVQNAMDEAVDQYVYLRTMRDKLIELESDQEQQYADYVHFGGEAPYDPDFPDEDDDEDGDEEGDDDVAV